MSGVRGNNEKPTAFFRNTQLRRTASDTQQRQQHSTKRLALSVLALSLRGMSLFGRGRIFLLLLNRETTTKKNAWAVRSWVRTPRPFRYFLVFLGCPHTRRRRERGQRTRVGLCGLRQRVPFTRWRPLGQRRTRYLLHQSANRCVGVLLSLFSLCALALSPLSPAPYFDRVHAFCW